MKNYTIIENELLDNHNLSDSSFRLYVLLKSMCYKDKVSCFPSQKYLAEKLGKSERTVQRLLRELYKANLVKKKRRGSISNLYTIVAKMMAKGVERVQDTVEKVTKTFKETKAKSTPSYNNYKKNKVDNFNNFEQREYNCSKLEELLLTKSGNLSNCLE